MEPKISVIIPVYQVEKYLSACIESVISQHYGPLEIILINDGSTDRSPRICDRYAEKHPNIKVLHKKNEGPAAARNQGIEIASGEYLMFLDSDDMLASLDILSHMAAIITKSNADILSGNYCLYKNGQPSDIRRHHLKNGAYVQTSEFRFNAFYRFGHLSYSWGKLYRKDFLVQNQILFKSYPLSEDKLFNLECYLKNAVYEFTDRPIIYYRQRPGAQTSRYYPDFISFWMRMGEELSKLRTKCHAPKEYEDISAFHCFFGALLLIKQELVHEKKTWSVKRSAAMLKQYASSPAASQIFHELAKGRYLQKLASPVWKLVIRSSAVLFSFHGYFLFALCYSFLEALNEKKK